MQCSEFFFVRSDDPWAVEKEGCSMFSLTRAKNVSGMKNRTFSVRNKPIDNFVVGLGTLIGQGEEVFLYLLPFLTRSSLRLPSLPRFARLAAAREKRAKPLKTSEHIQIPNPTSNFCHIVIQPTARATQ
jgi:hypothetical protein